MKSIERTQHFYLSFILSAYLWTGVIVQGYFFEVSFLPLNALLYAALSIYVWRAKSVKVSWLHIFLMAYCLLYWISCLYAIDLEGAILEAARISSLVPLAFFISGLPDSKRTVFMNQWPWAGTFLVVWGWLFALFRDGRLESTFEYANTLAIFLLAGMWLAWKAYHEQKRLLYLVPIGFQLVGLIQTGSRTVFVLFALSIVAFAGSLIANRKGRLLSLIAGIAGICAIFAIPVISSNEGIRRLANLKWNSSEFQLRLVYWRDALHLIRKVWYKGLGGDGWVVAQPSGYFVKYVHQHYLQLALDVGLAGLLLWVVMCGFYLYRGVKLGKSTFISTAVIGLLLLHAAFDIDFIYPLCLGLLVLLCSDIERKDSIPPFTIRRSGVWAITAVCVLSVSTFGWLGTGYTLKSAALRAGRQHHAGASIERLHNASRMMPWAHSLHIDLSNAYLMQWETTRDNADFKASINETDQAIELLPSFTKYQKRKKLLLSKAPERVGK